MLGEARDTLALDIHQAICRWLTAPESLADQTARQPAHRAVRQQLLGMLQRLCETGRLFVLDRPPRSWPQIPSNDKPGLGKEARADGTANSEHRGPRGQEFWLFL